MYRKTYKKELWQNEKTATPIIVEYKPSKNERKEKKDAFWNKLEDEMDEIVQKVMVMGYLNGRVGTSEVAG